MSELEATYSEALRIGKNTPSVDDDLNDEDVDAGNLALLKNRARKEVMKNKAEIKESFNDVLVAPTTKLLRASWEYLIPSWGLTWIWINIHWFMSCTWAEKFFAPLGHEWFLEAEKAGGVIAKERIRTLRNKANLLEKMGVAFTDVALLAALIFIVTIFYLMFEYFSVCGESVEKLNSPALSPQKLNPNPQ